MDLSSFGCWRTLGGASGPAGFAGGGTGTELGCPIDGRIALSEAPDAVDELVDTSGAAIEELFAWETGAAIFSDGRTVGR